MNYKEAALLLEKINTVQQMSNLYSFIEEDEQKLTEKYEGVFNLKLDEFEPSIAHVKEIFSILEKEYSKVINPQYVVEQKITETETLTLLNQEISEMLIRLSNYFEDVRFLNYLEEHNETLLNDLRIYERSIYRNDYGISISIVDDVANVKTNNDCTFNLNISNENNLLDAYRQLSGVSYGNIKNINSVIDNINKIEVFDEKLSETINQYDEYNLNYKSNLFKSQFDENRNHIIENFVPVSKFNSLSTEQQVEAVAVHLAGFENQMPNFDKKEEAFVNKSLAAVFYSSLEDDTTWFSAPPQLEHELQAEGFKYHGYENVTNFDYESDRAIENKTPVVICSFIMTSASSINWYRVFVPEVYEILSKVEDMDSFLNEHSDVVNSFREMEPVPEAQANVQEKAQQEVTPEKEHKQVRIARKTEETPEVVKQVQVDNLGMQFNIEQVELFGRTTFVYERNGERSVFQDIEKVKEHIQEQFNVTKYSLKLLSNDSSVVLNVG